MVAGLTGNAADDASRRPQEPDRPEDIIAGASRKLVSWPRGRVGQTVKAGGRNASASGDAMDGGVRILIDGSSGDARSGQNRKFITGLARGKRVGASRKDGNWTARRAKQPAQAGSELPGTCRKIKLP